MAKYTRTTNLGVSTRYSIILMSLLTLIGILSGCGASTTVSPSQPTGSTRTSTPTHKLKGTIREIPLPANFIAGDITNGPDGNVWIAGNPIGRISPTGSISEFSLPNPRGGPFAITSGPDGTIWFTERNSNKIGHLV